nr:hypothetical protein [Tanacetum cinerariifolium]
MGGSNYKLNKKTREKIVSYPRFISLLLKHMMPEYDNEELAINLTQEVPQGKRPRAKSGVRRKQSSKHTSESQTKASKSKTGQSETNSKSGHDASTDSTAKADPELSAPNNSISFNKIWIADDILKKIKLEDLLEFLKDIRFAFFTLDSPQDDLIIVTDESEEEEADTKYTHDTSHDIPEDTLVPPPSSLKLAQIQELMAQVTKAEGNDGIIMVNVIPPDHVDEVPVVEPNQPDDVPVVPEPVLVDEDEDAKEEEFKEEKDPQE